MHSSIDNQGNKVVNIFVIGCGGHAHSVISFIMESVPNSNIIVIDENAKLGEQILGCPVVKNHDIKEGDLFFVAIGDNNLRMKRFNELYLRGINALNVISKKVEIRDNCNIGIGCFIGAFSYIGPYVNIGENVIINTGSIIEHEAIIGNHSHISVGAKICGRARIGSRVFCGAGCVVIDRVNVCDDVIIGAGAIVVENIDVPGTYVGVPAKRIEI